MKKEKIVIIALSFFILAYFITNNINKEIHNIYGNKVITNEEADKLRETRNYNDDKIELFYNGIEIPFTNGYDEYILPQENNNEYIGLINCFDNNIVIIEDNYSKKERIENDIPLKVFIYNDSTYKTVYLKLTTLPIIDIFSFEYDKETGISFGDVRILDIGKDGKTGIINEKLSKIKYHTRGGTSVLFPKRSYKISLIKDDKKYKTQIAGLRKDDDWILNAMYIDESKIREEVAYDILNDLYGYKNENMKYCEVVINEEYLGVYNLQVPYDYKYFNLDLNRDFLVKVKLYRENFSNRLIFDNEEIRLKKQYIDEFNITQHEKIDYKKIVDLLRILVSDVYTDEIPTNYKVNHNLKLEYDIESSARYNVLINLIGAADNSSKNQMFIFKKEQGSNYLLIKHPWDLDFSMGEDFFGTIDKDSIFKDVYIPEIIENDENYFKKEQEIYFDIRDRYYNSEYIEKIIQKHYLELVKSGSIQRDYIKWNDGDTDLFYKDILNVYEYLNYRICLLDDYYKYNVNKHN